VLSLACPLPPVRTTQGSNFLFSSARFRRINSPSLFSPRNSSRSSVGFRGMCLPCFFFFLPMVLGELCHVTGPLPPKFGFGLPPARVLVLSDQDVYTRFEAPFWKTPQPAIPLLSPLKRRNSPFQMTRGFLSLLK